MKTALFSLVAPFSILVLAPVERDLLAELDPSSDGGETCEDFDELLRRLRELQTPVSISNGDVNGDGLIDITDSIHTLRWIFLEGPAPAEVPCTRSEAASGETGVQAGLSLRIEFNELEGDAQLTLVADVGETPGDPCESRIPSTFCRRRLARTLPSPQPGPSEGTRGRSPKTAPLPS